MEKKTMLYLYMYVEQLENDAANSGLPIQQRNAAREKLRQIAEIVGDVKGGYEPIEEKSPYFKLEGSPKK